MEQTKDLTVEEDVLHWLKSKNGKLTVKAAHGHFDRQTVMLAPWPWKMIWKVKIPHKVAYFCWLVAR